MSTETAVLCLIKKEKPINFQEEHRALLNFKEAILVWGEPRMIKNFVKYQQLCFR